MNEYLKWPLLVFVIRLLKLFLWHRLVLSCLNICLQSLLRSTARPTSLFLDSKGRWQFLFRRIIPTHCHRIIEWIFGYFFWYSSNIFERLRIESAEKIKLGFRISIIMETFFKVRDNLTLTFTFYQIWRFTARSSQCQFSRRFSSQCQFSRRFSSPFLPSFLHKNR